MDQVDFLIIGDRRDPHVAAIYGRLLERGIPSYAWNPSADPFNIQVHFDAKSQRVIVHEASVEVVISCARCVWFRRPGVLTVPIQIAESAHSAWRIEAGLNQRALFEVLSQQPASWINPYFAAMRAEIKTAQWLAAQQSGFVIPETILSNCPSAIRTFAAAHGYQIAHKMHHQARFENKRRAAGTYVLPESVLSNEQSLKAIPGIYQSIVCGHQEIRVLIAGCRYVAARLTNDGRPGLDMRDGLTTLGKAQKVLLPDAVIGRIQHMMLLLGLVTASIDLAELPNGDYVVFDVNQAGNFLWMDQMSPDMKTVDLLAEYIMSKFDKSKN